MSERDFGDITPRAFFNKMKGYLEEARRLYQDRWGRTRWLATVLANYSGKLAKKVLKPSDLLKFDWDKEKKSKSKKGIIEGKKRFEHLEKKWRM